MTTEAFDDANALRHHLVGVHNADEYAVAAAPIEILERNHADEHASTDVITIPVQADFDAIQDAVTARIQELGNMINDPRLPKKAHEGAKAAYADLLDVWKKFRGP
jgi:hypothetical protein